MSTGSGAHALIIEDEILIAFELEDRLREMGFHSFDVAATPLQAIELAQRRRPDLITADVRISGGTGIEAVRAIQQTLGQVPHFYVTGNVEMLDGVDAPAIVEKPIQTPQFRRACAAATGGAAPEGAAR